VRPRARLIWDIGDVPPVRGSEGRLGQVFLNLIVNAAHAIPEGNPEAHVIRLAVRREPDGKVAISVSDTGVGIAPEDLSRIFDPFFTTKPAGVGTGLGLWVCHNIVTAFGGALDVSSEVGRGTTFRVLLSAAKPGEAARPPRPQDGRGGRARRRLLVVDDEPLVAATVRRQLASDFVVDAASGAVDALARVANDRYDAIVCDVMMEGLNGLQFLDALRRQAPALAGRVLFVTGGASRESADLLAASGVPWIAKPFDGRQLRQAVRELLGSANAA
jgi:CheY-like chemotaxis protein